MNEIEIDIVNAVNCCISRRQASYVAPAITYTKSYWTQGQKAKEKVEYDETYWIHKDRTHYWFLTGHLRRILKFCKEHQVRIKFNGEAPSAYIPQSILPKLDGITLREDQIRLINNAIKGKRGVLKAPTRTGKTILQYGICSAYPTLNIVFLAHTIDLVNQLADEGKRFGFNIAVYTGKEKDIHWEKEGQIVVITRQSCVQILKDPTWHIWDFFDMIIVDEAHHVTTPTGQYAKILQAFNAPLRFGFTATLPNTIEAELSLEGHIGGLLGELTMEEAINKDLLVRPKIVLKKTPKVTIPSKYRYKYNNVYEIAVIDAVARNRIIARTAKEYIDQNKSVLILVTKIRHGENILGALREISFPDAFFVHGEVDTNTRKEVKQLLIDKNLMCVIATTVWKEGINIPTLDVCINAAGGKSEISTLQSVGRSLTKVKGKENALIVDFFDPSSAYLIEHFGERITLYFEQGWI